MDFDKLADNAISNINAMSDEYYEMEKLKDDTISSLTNDVNGLEAKIEELENKIEELEDKIWNLENENE